MRHTAALKMAGLFLPEEAEDRQAPDNLDERTSAHVFCGNSATQHCWNRGTAGKWASQESHSLSLPKCINMETPLHVFQSVFLGEFDSKFSVLFPVFDGKRDSQAKVRWCWHRHCCNRHSLNFYIYIVFIAIGSLYLINFYVGLPTWSKCTKKSLSMYTILCLPWEKQ